MTSNASQLSGVSGFSDDQDVDDFEHDGLITNIDGSWEDGFSLPEGINWFHSIKQLDILTNEKCLLKEI